MPRQFKCGSCDTVIVTYMRYGELIECKNCGNEVEVPNHAVETREVRLDGEGNPIATDDLEDFGPEPIPVVVTDFRMDFGSMVAFMIKWAFAAVPAAIILGFVFAIVSLLFGRMACS